MMTRFEKRIIAALMAGLMCGSMVQAPALTAYAAESAAASEEVTSEEAVSEEAVSEESSGEEISALGEAYQQDLSEAKDAEQESGAEAAEPQIENAADDSDGETTEGYLEIETGVTYTYESRQKYKFVPEETGVYTVKNLEGHIYGTVYDSDMNWYNSLGKAKLEAEQTYYIEIYSPYSDDTAVGSEWGLEKAKESKVKIDTAYVTNKSDNAVTYYAITPDETGWYQFCSDSSVTWEIYSDDSFKGYTFEWPAEDEGGYVYSVKLTAGETTYFLIENVGGL